MLRFWDYKNKIVTIDFNLLVILHLSVCLSSGRVFTGERHYLYFEISSLLAYCLKPNPVANGGYFITAVPKGRDNYDIGTELMFHCNMGYKISGKNSNIKCNLVDGKALWSQTFPTCQRK